jgi:predicted short-subunit dehydrogenase-like oxidoreductase (DUF2520 family)
MHIDIIGPGRLGRSLYILWEQLGHQVTLHGRGGCPPPTSEVIVLCVPDGALATVAKGLPDHAVVLHCSGATDLTPLSHLPHHGSLHPLMTFPGPEVSLPTLQGVTAAIAGTERARLLAHELATGLGMTPVLLEGDRRLYHAAAVIAGNYATLLLAEACEVLAAIGIPEEQGAAMLLPLATASLRNASPSPQRALTGPAARGDVSTLKSHVAALKGAGLDDTRRLYALLAERCLMLAGHSTATEHKGFAQELSTPIVVDHDGV